MAMRTVLSIHKAAVLLLALFTCVPLASAQKFLKLPAVEVFGGYSHLRFDSQPLGFSNQLNLDGWNVGLSLPDLYQGLGIAADVSGHYGSDMEEYNFMVGPQFIYPWKSLRPFGHALFGKARDRLRHPGNTELEPSTLGRAVALGGGLDVQLSPRLYIRAIQADYLSTNAFNSTQNNLRFSSGLIFRFGKR